ncbi:MAG: hypothetical protein WDZ89_03980 [Gemmatimonadota bacterium]
MRRIIALRDRSAGRFTAGLVSLAAAELLCGLALSPLPLRAHPVRFSPAALDFVQEAAVDSAAIVAEARRAQERFERIRRNNVPWAWGRWGGPCDEIIGRFCIWHTPGSDWVPPADAPAIVRARAELLDELQRLAETIPGDRWVLGQRIKYLGEADRWEEAAELARACPTGAGWWCDALLGFVRHNQGRYRSAEDVFSRALETMPAERAEEWHDLSLLLDRDGRQLVEDAPEGEREAMRDRIWWLGDPLFLVPGNERWTEHLARHVMVEIQRDARNAHWLRWGDDLTEILLRFGWSVAWERIRPDPLSSLSSLSVVGRERPGSLRFLPTGSTPGDPAGVGPDAWRLDDPAPRSKYASAEVKEVESLPYQLAVFPRGDSLLVVAAFELPESVREGNDGEGGGEPVEAGLFLIPEGLPVGAEPPPGSVRDSAGRVERFVAHLPTGSYILGLEAWSPAREKAWRHRQDLRPAPRVEGVPFLSGILLHHVAGDLPGAAEEAAETVYPSARTARGEPLGVSWEVYELAPREALSFRIAVEPESGGRLRRLGEWIGLVESPSSVVLAWTEPGPDGGGRLFRSAELDLDAMEPGHYILHLEVGLRGRDSLRTTRAFKLLP